MTQKHTTLYEVYDKRALHQPIDGLPLLDRDRDVKKALRSAREWGGVVARIKARILQPYPLLREVITVEIIFVHTPRPAKPEPRDKITIRQLRGKLRQIPGRNHFRR
jgi:hypothetical protein